MNSERFALIKKMQTKLNKNQAVLINSEKNRFYFTGLFSSAGFVLILDNEAYCLVDFRYFEVAKCTVKNCKVLCYEKFGQLLSELLKKHNIKSLMIENEKISLSTAQRIKDILSENNISLIDDKSLDNWILELRVTKSACEIKKIKEAQKITEAAFENVLNKLNEGVTEKEIAFEIEFFMRANGAQSMSFNPIVLFGENTSLPHGVPSNRKLKKGDLVLMDTGCVFEGYCSDMTRTVAYHSINARQKSVYAIVLKAQEAAIDKVKSGVPCSEVDKAARDIIYSGGYAACFGHATGHSLGLDIHECPSFSLNNDTTLIENTIMTVEPGIYLPGEFGVRIEDMVIVKDTGCKVITKAEHELIIV